MFGLYLAITSSGTVAACALITRKLIASKASIKTEIAFLMRLSFLTSELPRKTSEGDISSPRAAGPTHTQFNLNGLRNDPAFRFGARCSEGSPLRPNTEHRLGRV